MGRIYQQAHITIAAVNAETVTEDFLNPPLDFMKQPFWTQLLFKDLGAVFARCRNFGAEKSGPLDQCRWALQEQMLSPRVVAFDSYRMQWECASENYADDQGGEVYVGRHSLDMQKVTIDSSKRSLLYSEQEKFSIYLEWERIVEEYTKRSLLFPRDKLPPISAIAELYSMPLREQYLIEL